MVGRDDVENDVDGLKAERKRREQAVNAGGGEFEGTARAPLFRWLTRNTKSKPKVGWREERLP